MADGVLQSHHRYAPFLQIDGIKGHVSITSQKKVFVYQCVFGGETLAEGNEAVGMAATDPTVRVEVQLGEFAADESSTNVVWYRIRTVCQFPGTPEKLVVVHRRFKEFCAVDEQVRARSAVYALTKPVILYKVTVGCGVHGARVLWKCGSRELVLSTWRDAILCCVTAARCRFAPRTRAARC